MEGSQYKYNIQWKIIWLFHSLHKTDHIFFEGIKALAINTQFMHNISTFRLFSAQLSFSLALFLSIISNKVYKKSYINYVLTTRTFTKYETIFLLFFWRMKRTSALSLFHTHILNRIGMIWITVDRLVCFKVNSNIKRFVLCACDVHLVFAVHYAHTNTLRLRANVNPLGESYGERFQYSISKSRVPYIWPCV